MVRLTFTRKLFGPMMILSIDRLIDDAKCYEVVREIRWPDGVKCPHCGSVDINKRGFRERHPHRQRYLCKSCYYPFDDLSGTILLKTPQNSLNFGWQSGKAVPEK